MLSTSTNDGTKKLFLLVQHLRQFVPCLLRLLACWRKESGVNAVAILNWAVKMVLIIIWIRVGSLGLRRACFTLVIDMVFSNGLKKDTDLYPGEEP